MKILALSDHVAETIYSSSIKERFADVEMVLSCGDLPYSYLEYVVTLLAVPAFFVHGNHDRPEYTDSGATLYTPGGWVNLDGRVIKAGGLLLAGFEGSLRYKPDAPFQYTEAQMQRKILALAPKLLLYRLAYGRSVDVLITHAPPHGIHDGEDLPHRGFAAFRWFIARFKPRYLLHGHKHVYGPETTRTRHHSTTVVNVYPFTVIEV
ncbi:MAG: metallophosphoesterase family protein [Anaerolineae bacterium]|nr:metallophosphoesterase family protein [Anaerolineae bacterium]